VRGGTLSRVTFACSVVIATVAVGTLGSASATVPQPNVADLPSVGALPAAPTSATLFINAKSYLNGYVNPNITLQAGGTLIVENDSGMQHTVTSGAVNGKSYPDGKLFDTYVSAKRSLSVTGVSSLPAGTYKFHCRFHNPMKGTLTIVGSGGGALPPPTTFSQPLAVPPVLSTANIRIPIKQAQVQVFPSGPKTTMWTYGGTYPAPTISRPAGHDTKVTFTDTLPSADGAFSVHLHGDHHASAADGQPDSYLVHPGKSRTYNYPLTDHGQPEPAATFWYHDHRLGRTARNVWMGLAGFFFVHDGLASKLSLPTGKYDVPLLVADRSFDSNHQLLPNYPPTSAMVLRTGSAGAPPNDHTIGDKYLVNGRIAPYLRVSTHHYLLHLLNGSDFTPYDFTLRDQAGNALPFAQIGSGDSYFPKPVYRNDILLGPAQRADVIVDFHGELNKNVFLDSRSSNQATESTPNTELMQFRVRTKTSDSTKTPISLMPTPKISAPAKVSKTWKFDIQHNLTTGKSYWTVNGRMFDPSRADYRVPLGSTQTWKLVNNSKTTHFIHIHEEQWHTISRDGSKPPPWEKGLQDTWKLNPGEVVKVAAHFTDHTGLFMIHCHMLDHEDHGLMAQFRVYKPKRATATSAALMSPSLRAPAAFSLPAAADAVAALLNPTAPRPQWMPRRPEPLLAALSGQTSWLTSTRGMVCKPDRNHQRT
jgi:spore coat protein A